MASLKQTSTAFDLLPDELLLKIVKMAAICKGSQGSVPIKFNHNFLAHVLAKLSVRFKNISLDKIFWRNVYLEYDSTQGVVQRKVIENFLGNFTEVVWISANQRRKRKRKTTSTTYEDEFQQALIAIASKCTKLQAMIVTFPESRGVDVIMERVLNSIFFRTADLHYCYLGVPEAHKSCAVSSRVALLHPRGKSACCDMYSCRVFDVEKLQSWAEEWM